MDAIPGHWLLTDADGVVEAWGRSTEALLGADDDTETWRGQEVAALFDVADPIADALAAWRTGDQGPDGVTVQYAGLLIELKIHPVEGTGDQLDGFLIRVVAADPAHDALQDEFLASVSHELRTPLATLRGVALTMLEDPEMSPEDRTEFLAIIDREAQRLGGLIEDLVTLLRLGGGGDGRARPRPVDLRLHLSDLEHKFKQACEDLGIRLRFEYDDAKALLVRADPDLLAQTSACLIGRSLRSMSDGGQIRVVAEPDDGELVLGVVDDGDGIDPAELPHVFERFTQSKRSTRGLPGSGLGLALVKRIADAHGWRLRVDSSDDGTRVDVVMPLLDA